MNKDYTVFAAVAIFVLLILIIFPKWTVDDAYITFRYAENLVKHGEFTFNVGEDPVEGYTGILFPLGIALAMRIGIAPELMAYSIGIISLLVLLIVFYVILFRLCPSQFFRLWIFIVFASAPFLYIHVFSGLETIAFIALLLTSSLQLHSLINSTSDSSLSYAALALTLLALSLCRPEGGVYAGIVAIILSVTAALHITPRRSFIFSFFIFLALPGILYFAWRWRYYGYPLPNTFYAKQVSSLFRKSLYDLACFCIQYLLLPTSGVIVFLVLSLNTTLKHFHQKYFRLQKRADSLMLGSLILFSLIITTQYLRSHLTMNFSYRFFVPFYPIALFLLCWLLFPIFETIRQHPGTGLWQNGIVPFGLCMIFLTQIAFHTKWLFMKEIPYATIDKKCISEMHRPAGLFLKRRMPGSEWLVVHIDAGAIPFYSGLRTVDFGGINDEYLAHNKSASIADRVNYFFSKKPGAVVFTTYDWNRVNHGPEAKAIISNSRFNEYKLVRKFGNTVGLHYYEFIFLRKDLIKKGEEITLL